MVIQTTTLFPGFLIQMRHDLGDLLPAVDLAEANLPGQYLTELARRRASASERAARTAAGSRCCCDEWKRYPCGKRIDYWASSRAGKGRGIM